MLARSFIFETKTLTSLFFLRDENVTLATGDGEGSYLAAASNVSHTCLSVLSP
jgi:hypothetical protein